MFDQCIIKYHVVRVSNRAEWKSQKPTYASQSGQQTLEMYTIRPSKILFGFGEDREAYHLIFYDNMNMGSPAALDLA